MSITTLAEVGLKATEYKKAVDARKLAVAAFVDACFRWKNDRGIGFIERNSDQWEQMLCGVADEHDAVSRAKANERNARERLFRACRRVEA